jgi:hypothetical protein
MSWRVTAPLRSIGRLLVRPERRHVLNIAHIRHCRLETEPFQWAAIHSLFTENDAGLLAVTYPRDHFKSIRRSDAAREYCYQARSLIGLGASAATFQEELSDVWRRLAGDLLSTEYRHAMSRLTGRDLEHAPMEANIFHYGRGDSMDAHQDLPEKIVTHVLYFNRSWNAANGGCLRILRSSNVEDIAAEISPIAGSSCVIVRSENSWHAVSPVRDDSAGSRKCVTVTFYRPGSVSTMWPPGEIAALHTYAGPDGS